MTVFALTSTCPMSGSHFSGMQPDITQDNLNHHSHSWLDSAAYSELQDRSTHLAGSRVCDRCMVKKIKCNRQRPSCSRCLEESTSCVYSSAKKKPGPVKGSRRKKASPSASARDSKPVTALSIQQQLVSDNESSRDPFAELLSQQIYDGTLASSMLASVSEPPSRSPGNTHTYGLTINRHSPVDLQLQPQQERRLLNDYFSYLQPSMPLFDEATFYQRYDQGLIRRELLLTLLAAAAQIQGLIGSWGMPSLKGCLEQLLAAKPFEEENNNDSISIEAFQQACLLAFYEFHQHPGPKACSRISELTRRAYQCGLHQIDNPDQCILYDLNSMTVEETKDWRRLWWCIYALDSSSNITAATPFVVELDSVRTALPSIGSSDSGAPIYLCPDTEFLWRTAKEITSRPGDTSFHVHIVTTTLLREAESVSRLWRLNPSSRAREKLKALEDHLSAIKLALPTRYLDVTRNVMSNESTYEHHARLVTILHLHAARLLIEIPRDLQSDAAEWMRAWHQTLEFCEDIVSVVKQWKAQACLSVDPTICFIISAVLMLLHLHSRTARSTEEELQARIRAHKNILLLFLEQFASIWQLPRFMLGAYGRFTELFQHPVTAMEIEMFLRRSQGQLHQSFLKLLSLTTEDLSPPEQLRFDKTFLSSSDFNNWESWANVPDMSYMG